MSLPASTRDDAKLHRATRDESLFITVALQQEMCRNCIVQRSEFVRVVWSLTWEGKRQSCCKNVGQFIQLENLLALANHPLPKKQEATSTLSHASMIKCQQLDSMSDDCWLWCPFRQLKLRPS